MLLVGATGMKIDREESPSFSERSHLLHARIQESVIPRNISGNNFPKLNSAFSSQCSGAIQSESLSRRFFSDRNMEK
jgi:hypothetical protein